MKFVLIAVIAIWSLSACDDATEFKGAGDGNDCASDEFVNADGACEVRTFSVQENADYTRYVGGGTAAFSVEGKNATDVPVRLNGEEVTPATVGNRLFVSIPRGTSGDIKILVGEEAGESTSFDRTVGTIELLDSEESIVSNERETTGQLLEGTESKVRALQNNAPGGLLEASESVNTGLDDKLALLEADERTVTAEEISVLVPIMLQSQEAPTNVSEAAAAANKIVALDRLRKQENDTCAGVIEDLERINDALSFEAGSLLSIATPLIAGGEFENAAAILAGIGWTYWIDDMLAFLEGVDQFATICAATTYEAQLAGESANGAIVASAEPTALEVAVTREFGDEAANLAKQELKPLIDFVMETVGGFYGGFNVDVAYLDQAVLTGALDAGSIEVSVPADSGVTAETVIEGESLLLTLTLDEDITSATTVAVTVSDLVRDDDFTFDVEVTPEEDGVEDAELN